MKLNLVKRLHLPSEIAKRLRFSWGLHFLFQFGWIISWVVVTALFVEKFGLENLLYLFSIEAILLILSTFIAHKFLRCVPTKKVVNCSAAAIIALVMGSFLVSNSEHVYILFGLALIAKDVFYPRLRMGLLRNTEELFTPEQAERAIPITESALTVGTVSGAGFLLTMIRFMPDATTQSMFVWWVLPLLIIIALLAFEPRILSELPELHKNKEEQFYESRESSFKNALTLFKKIPFLRTIAILVALQAAVFSIVEYETVSHLEDALHHNVTTTEFSFSPQDLSASLLDDMSAASKEFIQVTNREIKEFSSKVIAHNTLLHDLSALSLFFGLIALFVHFVISPYLIKRHGIIRTMFTYFIGLLCILPILLLGGSWPIAGVRSYEHGFHSLFSAGYHLSFYSTFSKQREFLRHMLEGIIAPLGVLFGVGTLLALKTYGAMTFFPILLAVLVGTLVLITRRMIPRYTKLSIENLHSAHTLREQMHAIEILGQNGHNTQNATSELCALLKNEKTHHVLREKIIHTLQKIQSPHVVHEFSKILERDNESDEVKIKILEAMLEFNSLKRFWESKMFAQHKFLEILNTLFDITEHAHLKKLIVMNIFSHLPADKVVPFFLKTMETADENLQAVCLRSCRMFNDPDIVSYVEPYLTHENSKVRSHALIALWKFQDTKTLLPHLHKFFESEDHESIVAGLYAVGELGEQKHHHLIEQFANHDNPEWKLHSLVARAKIGDKSCFKPLMKMMFDEDEMLARKVFAMLKRVPVDIRNELLARMQKEIARQVWSIVGHNPKPEIIQGLPSQRREYLRRLYLFANQHDNILVLEQTQSA